MNTDTQIQSVMTLCPHSVGFEQDIKVAHDMMRKHNFRHLPVQHGGRLVGIISDRDIKYATGWTKAADRDLMVQDVYVPEPYVVDPTTRLEEVLRRMIQDQIGCVLVAIHGDKLVGIFTTTDACRCLANSLSDN